MRCPCCGALGVQRATVFEGLQQQLWKVIGAVAFVSAAILGQAHLVGEPWEHLISVTGTIAAALVAWNIKQHPVKEP